MSWNHTNRPVAKAESKVESQRARRDDQIQPVDRIRSDNIRHIMVQNELLEEQRVQWILFQERYQQHDADRYSFLPWHRFLLQTAGSFLWQNQVADIHQEGWHFQRCFHFLNAHCELASVLCFLTHELMSATWKQGNGRIGKKWWFDHLICQNTATESLKLYRKSCLSATHLLVAHICFIAYSLFLSSAPLPNSTFCNIWTYEHLRHHGATSSITCLAEQAKISIVRSVA